MKSVYENKDKSYYSGVREDLISLLPKNIAQKILEIGAGGGNTLVEIKRRGLASEVVGVDLFRLKQSSQKSGMIDKFIIANLEADTLDLPLNYFDVIIAGDVLEHLTDPWEVVNKLTPFLKSDGHFIVSVPNIRELGTIYKIFFKGNFEYNPEGGILDKTHLRFFCKKNLQDLFNKKKYRIISIRPPFDIIYRRGIKRLFNKLTFGLFEEFMTSQYVIITQKN